jgi:hypothetical protein
MIRPQHRAPAKRLPSDVLGGIRFGCAFAAGFSVIAGVGIFLSGGRGVSATEALGFWVRATAFYFVAGVLGGALWGALRPIQHRYVGRYLTAYLVLYLVYGGGTAAFLPVMRRDLSRGGPPLSVMLAVWAVLCLVLAPVYVAMFRDHGEPDAGADQH